MELENHKEEVPFEHYLEKYKSLDPEEAAQRLNILYDASAGRFQLRFMGREYQVDYPAFAVRPADPEERRICFRAVFRLRRSSCVSFWKGRI